MKTPSWANRLMNLIGHAPNDLLLMSRADCHALKVSSIVFGRNRAGGLARVFLAWPGHQLAENRLYGRMPVGIHDHRYKLRLQLLMGKVRNTIYRRTEHHAVPMASCRVLHEFQFVSGEMKGKPQTRRVGFTAIHVHSECWLSPDDFTVMAATEFHDVDCVGPAAWFVEEGPVEQAVTTLFTPNAEVDTSDLYQAFANPAEVRAHVAQFIREATR
jgi:hypothetical protein